MQNQNQTFKAYCTLFLYGVTTIFTQILIFRELYTRLGGNELIAGLTFGFWLLLTGLGSFLLPQQRLFKNKTLNYLVFLHPLLPIITLVSVSGLNYLTGWFNIVRGEVPDLLLVTCITLIALAPVCLYTGWLYTLSCQMINVRLQSLDRSVQSVYWTESLGACLGGFLLGVWLLNHFSPILLLSILIGLHLCNLAYQIKSRFIRIVLLCISAALLWTAPKIQKQVDQQYWQNQHVLEVRDSPYGRLTVTRLADQVQCYQNGAFLFAHPDPCSAEYKSHIPLLCHANPESVLLLGGGLDGTAREILKHPSVEKLEVLEIDPILFRLSEKWIKGNTPIFNEKGVEIHHTDARAWIQKESRAFDLIIMHLPEPSTLQWNRYYTVEFFQSVRKILKQDGIFCFTIPSSENAISPDLGRTLAIIQNSLRNAFSQVTPLPGEQGWFFATNQEKPFYLDVELMIARLEQRGIRTQYVRDYYLPFIFSEERISWIQAEIGRYTSGQINTDFHPVSLKAALKNWTVYFAPFLKNLFKTHTHQTYFIVLIFMILQGIMIILFKTKRKETAGLKRIKLLYLLAIVGCTEISVVIILVFCTQISLGQAYQHIALVIAGYMAGLVLGSSRMAMQKISSALWVKAIQASMFLYTLVLLAGLIFLIRQPVSLPEPIVIFLLLLLASMGGWLGGRQFICINALFFKTEDKKNIAPGKLYAADLFGASAGALLTTLFLIPAAGLLWTLLILGMMNLVGWIVISGQKI